MNDRRQLARRVVTAIQRAFAGVTLGAGVGLRQAQGIDDYADAATIAAYRATDETLDWSRISAQTLNECNSSLCFFDAEGMRFHLPAYLIADLQGAYQFGMADCLVDIGDLRAQQFALLSEAQRTAVRQYLDYIAEEESYAWQRPNILRVLDEYWAS